MSAVRAQCERSLNAVSSQFRRSFLLATPFFDLIWIQ